MKLFAVVLSATLYLAPSQPGVVRPLTDFAASYPAWSPDGSRIAFESTRDGDDAEIYVVELAEQRVTRLTDNQSDDSQPVWSPDGSFIAFVSEREGNPEIFRMRADGSEQVRLTRYPKRDLHPRFSPDGARILFNRETGEGRSSTAEIYEMGRDGTEPRQLARNRFPYTYPSWSPDGGEMLFVQWFPPTAGGGRPNTEIALLEAGGSEPTRLTDAPGFDGYPSWSPDGSQIAFASNRVAGRRQLFVMNEDGSGLVQLTESERLEFAAPSWSPDGTRIVASGHDGQMERLYVVSLARHR